MEVKTMYVADTSFITIKKIKVIRETEKSVFLEATGRMQRKRTGSVRVFSTLNKAREHLVRNVEYRLKSMRKKLKRMEDDLFKVARLREYEVEETTWF